MQLKHDIAFLTRNDKKLSLFEVFLHEIRILASSDAPKDFDKYFKPPKSTSERSSVTEEKSKNSETPKRSSSSPSSNSKSSPDTKPPPDWNFGMFGPSPSSQSSKSGSKGRPIGGEPNPDQGKMILYGALGFAAFVVALTMFELGYKEISWKDFTNK